MLTALLLGLTLMLTPFLGAALAIGAGLLAARESRKNRKSAERHAKKERKRQERREAEIRTNVGRVDALFDRPELADLVSQAGETVTEQGVDAAQAGFADDVRQLRQTIGRRGLVGSSVDVGGRARALGGLFSGQQQAHLAGRRTSASLQSRLDDRRRQMIAAIRGGTAAAPDASRVLAEQDAIFAGTQGGLVDQTIGTLANQTADTIGGLPISSQLFAAPQPSSAGSGITVDTQRKRRGRLFQ